MENTSAQPDAQPDPGAVAPDVNVPDNVDTSDPAAPASAPVNTAGNVEDTTDGNENPADVIGDALADPNKIDAILRDPNVPGDVRAFVVMYYGFVRYTSTVEFYEDGDNVTHVRTKGA